MKETEAVNQLEKKYKSGPQYSQKEAVELAISTLQACCCGGVPAVPAVLGAAGRRRHAAGRANRSAGHRHMPTMLALSLPSPPLPLPRPQHVLGEDLKASDIEVGLASTTEGGRFRVLGAAELEEHLVAISERD